MPATDRPDFTNPSFLLFYGTAITIQAAAVATMSIATYIFGMLTFTGASMQEVSSTPLLWLLALATMFGAGLAIWMFYHFFLRQTAMQEWLWGEFKYTQRHRKR